jgi:flagellar motor protein MotB
MLGGKRPGAGRPKGVPNKRGREALARGQALLETGADPVEVMLQRMRDPDSVSYAQFEAAQAVAPYVHPRLSAIAAKIEDVSFAKALDAAYRRAGLQIEAEQDRQSGDQVSNSATSSETKLLADQQRTGEDGE